MQHARRTYSSGTKWIGIAFAPALLSCGSVPCRSAAEAARDKDPFSIVDGADSCVAAEHYEDALKEYLWALDHGRALNARFIPADHFGAVVDLGKRYGPAREALRQRTRELAGRIVAAASGGANVDDVDLMFFGRVSFALGDDAAVMQTYDVLRTRLPITARLRQELWEAIEEHLVAQRRYQEAVSDSDVATASVRFYLGVFEPIPRDVREKLPGVSDAVRYTLEHPCALHFEGLLGTGRRDEARDLAERLVRLSPEARTFALLIAHAQRAGATDEVARLQGLARSTLPVEMRP